MLIELNELRLSDLLFVSVHLQGTASLCLTFYHFCFQGEFEDRPLPNFFAQFLTFLIRENFLQFRYMKSLLLDLGLVLLAGGVLGGLYSDVSN